MFRRAKSICKHVVIRIVKALLRLWLPVAAWLISKAAPGNTAYPYFKKRGMHLLREHFYLPIPENEDVAGEFWTTASKLPGIDVDEKSMIQLAGKTLEPYHNEFRSFPETDMSGKMQSYYLVNGGYMAVDGNMYYGLVRHLKPNRIVEIGCGMSSLLCLEALKKNKAEGDVIGEYLGIEPYPVWYLTAYDRNPLKLVQSKVQDIPMDTFTSLSAGDILFIDTTHVLRMGGDVQYLYCEVLPRIKPGVYIHIHDISLPMPYPKVYFEESHYYWNEQYLLQAYLVHNNQAEIIWAGNWINVHRHDDLLRIFPEFQTMRKYFPQSEPSAFWFRTRDSQQS